LSGTLGWHHIVEQVASVYDSLPPAERSHTVVLTGDYSEAGAVNYWRRAPGRPGPAGLPVAISGHNSYWLWGWGSARQDDTTIVVGLDPHVSAWWSDCRVEATLGQDGTLIDKQEVGNTIAVCRGQLAAWSVIWPHLRHYD
jgi:hypothetical protein